MRPAASVSAELLEQLVPAGPRRGAAHPVEAAHHRQVLPAGEVLVDRGVLPGQADPLAQPRGLGDDVEPRDADLALVGPQQRGEDPHRGRLARAVGTEQRRGRCPARPRGRSRRAPGRRRTP